MKKGKNKRKQAKKNEKKTKDKRKQTKIQRKKKRNKREKTHRYSIKLTKGFNMFKLVFKLTRLTHQR